MPGSHHIGPVEILYPQSAVREDEDDLIMAKTNRSNQIQNAHKMMRLATVGLGDVHRHVSSNEYALASRTDTNLHILPSIAPQFDGT